MAGVFPSFWNCKGSLMAKRRVYLGLIAALAVLGIGLQASGGWTVAYGWLRSNVPGLGAAAATAASDQAQAQQGQGQDKNKGKGKTPATPQAGAGSNRGPAPVEVAEAKLQTLQDSISVIGSLAAQESVTVAADTAGRIVAVSVTDGTAVKAGDELFRLDGALLAAELSEAEARLRLAQTTYERNRTLAKSNTVAQSNLDQSKAELDLAQTAKDLAEEKISRLVVRAPFDGYLGFRQVSVGAYVTAGMPLVTLDQITALKVSFSVPERYFTALSQGQTVDITADAVPGQSFTATITAINPVVDVNGRALQVQAALGNAALALRPGMLVRASVMGAKRDAVTIAEAAIVPQGNGNVVFSVKDGKAQRQVVNTGQRRDGWVEITSGLSAGTQVVSAGATRLSDGAAVKVAEPSATE